MTALEVLQAKLAGPETTLEAVGNTIQALKDFAMMPEDERAGQEGLRLVYDAVERLSYVRARLIDLKVNL